MADEPEVFYVYRRYQSAPFSRWALNVVEDRRTPAGYRIVASDPKIADAVLLSRFVADLAKPVTGYDSEVTKEGVFRVVAPLKPGDADYFETVILGGTVDLWHAGTDPESA